MVWCGEGVVGVVALHLPPVVRRIEASSDAEEEEVGVALVEGIEISTVCP